MKRDLYKLAAVVTALVVMGLCFAWLTVHTDAMDISEIVPEAVYYDSNGAEAYGWELIEGIRLMMLECGASTVPVEDKVEHCAVLCKQLYYTQVVGGYNGWGTTLWGVMHAGNSYLQTAPRIWTEDAEPTQEIIDVFWDVWCNGYSSDFRVQCYRLDWFFQGDWPESAYQIGRTCYSRNIWQDFSMFDLNWDGSLNTKMNNYTENDEKVYNYTYKEWFEPEETELELIFEEEGPLEKVVLYER